MTRYVWEKKFWPRYRFSSERLLDPLGAVRFQQGALLHHVGDLGFDVQRQTQAEALVQEAIKTSEIESLRLDPNAVRSSVALRLDLPTAGLPRPGANREAEGIVSVLIDATVNFRKPLTVKRLNGWHAALFPTGYSGLLKISVGRWRDDKNGPMKVVSGPSGRETTHYIAPPAASVPTEMKRFLSWWRKPPAGLDGVLRSAIAHLWFVQIHPFDDGNGRVARALSEMALTQDERSPMRFYSLSSQIRADLDAYYQALETAGTGDGDITQWVIWYLASMTAAMTQAEKQLRSATVTARFWKLFSHTRVNDAQEKVIGKLLDLGPGGFEGALNNRKYRGINHTSRATAQRDLADLVQKGILVKNPGGGRSVSYDLNWEAIK